MSKLIIPSYLKGKVEDKKEKVESEVELIIVTISGIIDLDADDYIEGYVYIDRTTNTNRITSSEFSAFKVIGA